MNNLNDKIYRDSVLGENGDFTFDKLIPKINIICKNANSQSLNTLWSSLDILRNNDIKNNFSSFEGLPWITYPYVNTETRINFNNNNTETIVDISAKYVLETLVNQIL